MSGSTLLAAAVALLVGADPAVILSAPARPTAAWRWRAAIRTAGEPCPEPVAAYWARTASAPADGAAWRCLAIAQARREPVLLRTSLMRWTELRPDDADGWLVRGIVFNDASALREALWLRPDDADAWNALATVCADTATCPSEMSVSAIRTAVRLRPDFGEAWLNRAHLEWRDREAALLSAREATRLRPDVADAWRALGRSLSARALDLRYSDAARAADLAREAVEAQAAAVLLEPRSSWSELEQACAVAADKPTARTVARKLEVSDPMRARRFLAACLRAPKAR